jgi:hypothetical protein
MVTVVGCPFVGCGGLGSIALAAGAEGGTVSVGAGSWVAALGSGAVGSALGIACAKGGLVIGNLGVACALGKALGAD